MCWPGQKMEKMQPIPELEREIVIDEPIKSIDPKLSILNFPKKAIHISQSYKCYFCEKIVDFLFKEMNQTQTREYIKSMLDKSCGKLFKKEERESKCEEYVSD